MKTKYSPGWMALGCLFFLIVTSHAADVRVPQDHETIQAAIDSAKFGDRVLVSAGTYRELVTLKPGVTLRSAGEDEKGELGLARAEATVIDGTGIEGEHAGVTMAEDAVIDGFTVTGIGKYDEAKWQAHWDTQGNNQSHDHIGHFGRPGIAVMGVNCRVVNNIVHHVDSTGIAIAGQDGQPCHPVVSGNTCYRNMGGGIGSMNHSAALIEGNTCFENFYAGIGHDNASPMVIGNTCYENIRAGIGVSEGACPVVRGNKCYRNRRAGIGIRTGEATRPLIEDNDCYENAMSGIGTEEEARPVIRGNRCHHNKLAGIGAQEHAEVTLIGNHCYENGAAGIGLRGAGATILENRIEKNGSSGIGISAKSHAVIIGNTCSENKLVAVGVPSGEAVMEGNTFVRTGGMPPIMAIFGDSSVTLVGNTIRGGGVAAILLEGKLEASGNTIEGQNGGAGIWAKEGSELVMAEGNVIKGYKTEVRGGKK